MIPSLSFQFLGRPGCTAKLLCFLIAGRFESHRLHHLQKPKNLPEKTANRYHPLLPHLLFFLAFQDESFTLCEENSLWHTSRSSHASTPVMGNFRTSTCSSRRIIVRFRSKEPLTTYVLAAGAGARQSE